VIARRRSSSDSTALARYDAAKQALAEAHRVDEVKSIRDKAVAMQHYARQAKDDELIKHATEIRMRAERKAGELLIEMSDRGERARQGEGRGKGRKLQPLPKLSDLGISKTQSSRWQAIARIPVDEFERQTERVARGEREILETEKTIRAQKAQERYTARIARIARAAAGNTALPTDQRYPVIYADPSWDYELYSETGASSRAASEKYPVMPLAAICALPVGQLATDDAILFMWTTAPHLQQAFTVLDAWEFKYTTNITWVKHAQGTGYFVRGQHEHLLIATRGDIPCPLPANRPASVIVAPRGEHSRKPDEAYELIERMYPDLPKIELFARQTREGWASWGKSNQPPGGRMIAQMDTQAAFPLTTAKGTV
jgi:N6-adenosine-specific RNA methylase IME4